MGERKFKVIVWGATGFTGQLVSQYLAGKPNLPWAVAGRSQEKLQAVVQGLTQVHSSPAIVVCDLQDQAALEKLAASTNVILSTAGPFTKVGTPIVQACMSQRTDYVDITGEVTWVRSMMDQYEEQAKSNNIILCSCCGFDSVPSDLGTLFGTIKLKEKYGWETKVGNVRSYVVMRGGASGGTLASGIMMEKDPVTAQQLKNPFLLGGQPSTGPRAIDEDFTRAELDSNLNVWVAPFGMASINTRIVRRSNALLEYGKSFAYQEVAIAPSEKAAQKMASGGPPAKKREEMVAAGRLPKPGQGPPRELRQKSFFHMVVRVEAEGDSSKHVLVKVSGRDPGYDETAKMVAEGALCLATQRKTLPRKGGFLTPAAAMGTALIERLVANGISFDQVSLSDLPSALQPPTTLAKL